LQAFPLWDSKLPASLVAEERASRRLRAELIATQDERDELMDSLDEALERQVSYTQLFPCFTALFLYI
jgi:hypothetical protein|tara:strand:+ start:279 stop:482 length:204 start_codon:yes stop_codon:yes gene_type:complete